MDRARPATHRGNTMTRVVQRRPRLAITQRRPPAADTKTASQATSIGRSWPSTHRPSSQERMQRDHERIVRRAEFDAALCAQARGVPTARDTSSASRCDDQERDQPRPLTHAQPRARAEVCGETRAERREHRRAAQAAPQRALENEQHGRRRHVAVVAQHFALVAQRAFLQFERDLDRVEHLGAARMTDETAAPAASQP